MSPKEAKEKKIPVGCRLAKERYNQVKELAEKEKWSMTKVTEVAVEYYLKARGYEI